MGGKFPTKKALCITFEWSLPRAICIVLIVHMHEVRCVPAANYLETRRCRTTEYRKNRVRTPPVVRASGVGSARSVLEVNGNNAL